MGGAVVRRLLSAQIEVTVYNRTKDKAQALVDEGARWVETPADAARAADFVITMVKDQHSVKALTLGENGILAGMSDRCVHAEMSTVSPQSAADLENEYTKRGKKFVQAPVLGSKRQIEDSTLLIMAGGSRSAIESCQPVWQAFSKRTWSLGSAAEAAALKLSCNMLIAQMILGLGQSMLFAQSFGIDPEQLLDLLDHSALGSAMYKSKGNSILADNFQANFTVDNMLKDLELARDAADGAGLSLLANNLASSIFERATKSGFGDKDYSSVIKVLAEPKSEEKRL